MVNRTFYLNILMKNKMYVKFYVFGLVMLNRIARHIDCTGIHDTSWKLGIFQPEFLVEMCTKQVILLHFQQKRFHWKMSWKIFRQISEKRHDNFPTKIFSWITINFLVPTRLTMIFLNVPMLFLPIYSAACPTTNFPKHF